MNVFEKSSSLYPDGYVLLCKDIFVIFVINLTAHKKQLKLGKHLIIFQTTSRLIRKLVKHKLFITKDLL